MAKTLDEYMGEIASSYSGMRGALQKQLDAIDGNLATQKAQINKQYANQQAQLQRNANNAAGAASMAAAGSGGSFGGKAAIANQKYFSQSFVPAMIESQTNHASALENADLNANSRRDSLSAQLASLQDTIAQSAQKRFYDQQEADRQYELQQQQLALQKQQINAQNAYNKYIMQAAQTPKYANVGSGADFQWRNTADGSAVKLGTVVANDGGDFNSQLKKYLTTMANAGDASAQMVLRQMNAGAKFAQNSGSSFRSTGNNIYDILGIKLADGNGFVPSYAV